MSTPHTMVSVVVPCYCYGQYLDQCVASILGQEGVEVRILIIDDASPDNSFQTAQRLADSDPRVQARRHETNRGNIATFNEGLLEWAEGEYSVLISADDLLPPGALLRATNLLAGFPSVGFVYGYPRAFNTDDPPPPHVGRVTETVWRGRDWIEQICRHGGNFIQSSEVVMRTSVQKMIGGYRSELPHSGDMEMWLRAARHADVGRVNGCDQAFYRVHPKSMQRTIHAGALTDLRGRRDAFRSALSAFNAKDQDLAGLLQVAERSVATSTLKGLLERADLGDPVSDATVTWLAFARETSPEIVDTELWRVVEERMANGPGHTAVVRMRVAWRKFQDTLAWRRWRRTGIG